MTDQNIYEKYLQDQLTPELKARESRSMATPPGGEPFTIEGVKVLFLLFGGATTALATWFQHSLSGLASAAQNAMLIPILVAMTSCIVGLLLTSILAVNRDKGNLISHQFDVAQAQAIVHLLRSGMVQQDRIAELRAEAADENWDFDEVKRRLNESAGPDNAQATKFQDRLDDANTKLDTFRARWDMFSNACYGMLFVAIISIAIGGWNAVGLVKSDPCAQPAPVSEQSTTN